MDATLLHLGREALLLALTLSAPPLVAALVTGLVTGIAQAATQVQEPSLGVVPRLVAVLGALLIAGPWIGVRLGRFASDCLIAAARGGP